MLSYLDNNGTTPIDPSVSAAIVPFLTSHFGNPSSSHAYGAVPHAALSEARRSVAMLLGCDASEVTFTSGGSEAINWALKGVRSWAGTLFAGASAVTAGGSVCVCGQASWSLVGGGSRLRRATSSPQ
jgi:selenocysteine lyase/cysteine desulfurase